MPHTPKLPKRIPTDVGLDSDEVLAFLVVQLNNTVDYLESIQPEPHQAYCSCPNCEPSLHEEEKCQCKGENPEWEEHTPKYCSSKYSFSKKDTPTVEHKVVIEKGATDYTIIGHSFLKKGKDLMCDCGLTLRDKAPDTTVEELREKELLSVQELLFEYEKSKDVDRRVEIINQLTLNK